MLIMNKQNQKDSSLLNLHFLAPKYKIHSAQKALN